MNVNMEPEPLLEAEFRPERALLLSGNIKFIFNKIRRLKNNINMDLDNVGSCVIFVANIYFLQGVFF